MSTSSSTGVDLVPLGERMRMISAFRAVAVALILGGWQLLPSARGDLPFSTIALVSLGYLAATLLIEAAWRASGRRATWIFGVFAMADGVFLTWASFGQGGLASPLVYLLIGQIVTVSLLASFRTGLKLAIFNAWVLIAAAYLTEAGLVDALGGPPVTFGDDAYWALLVVAGAYVLVALVTTSFAAVNERELRRRRYDLEALARFALELEAVEEPGPIAERLLAGVADIYDCEPSMVLRREGEGLRVLAARGLDDVPANAVLVGDAAAAPVVTKAMADYGTTLVATSARTGDAALAPFGDGANLLITPMRDEHGEVVGALVARHSTRRGSRVERRVVTMVERFVSHASLAIANAYLLVAVRDLAVTDGLTGLPNRRHLDDLLTRSCAQIARGQGTLAIVMVDVDHFKKFNDTHGHQAGDDVLRVVGRTLSDQVRAGDTATRYGGEEFCVVMPGASREDAMQVAERLRVAITEMPIAFDVTASFGVAIGPVHGTEPEVLREAADAALYDAKHGGRNRVAVAPEPGARLREVA